MLNSCHQSPYNNIGRVIRGENNTQTKYIFNYEKKPVQFIFLYRNVVFLYLCLVQIKECIVMYLYTP